MILKVVTQEEPTTPTRNDVIWAVLGRSRTDWLSVNSQSQGNEPRQAAVWQDWREQPTNQAPSLALPHLILAVQFLIGYVGREIGVKQCTESQPIVPAAAEVCDVDILREERRKTWCALWSSLRSAM